MRQWSVPASILLAGEYAITREGGTGIAVATAPRAHVLVRATVTPDSIQCFRRALYALETGKIERIPGLELEFLTGSPQPVSSRIIMPVLREVTGYIRHTGYIAPGPYTASRDPIHIALDTSAFFGRKTGRKLGYGSSGAATVLLTAAFLYLAGIDPLHHRPIVLTRAVNAHRALQGGRGSGYDVACSILGGSIRFVGGEIPRWERLDLIREWATLGVRLYVWHGDKPVGSGSAVEAFDHHFPRDTSAAAEIITRSNEAVAMILGAGTWPHLVSGFKHAGAISREIGTRIGVPADLPGDTLPNGPDWIVKASGAGNEQAIILARAGNRQLSDRQRLREIVPETDGLRREETRKDGL